MYYQKKRLFLRITLKKSFIYENNELHGISKVYNGKGELEAEGFYKRGKKTGIWKFYKNNELVTQKDYTYIPKFKKNKN